VVSHCKNTHTHPFSGPFSGTTHVSRYQKAETDLDFTEARDSEWQWNQLGRMQVCNSLQTDNHASTPPLHFLQARCPSCRPTNSVKALKDSHCKKIQKNNLYATNSHCKISQPPHHFPGKPRNVTEFDSCLGNIRMDRPKLMDKFFQGKLYC